MFLKGSKRMRKGLKISAWVLCILLLLIITGIYFVLPAVLRKNGITYTDKDFDFPGTLKVEGLKIDQPNLKADIQEIKINVSLSDLFDGRLTGDYMVMKEGKIQYTVIPSGKPYDSNFLKDIIPVHFKKVEVFNIVFTNLDRGDTLTVNVPELLIHNVTLDTTWHIDSFKTIGTKVAILSRPDTSKRKQKNIAEKKERGFSMADIPEYTIGNLSLSDCSFELHSATQHHSLKKINLDLNRKKETGSIAMAVNRFSLLYQDSFGLDLSSNRILINGQKEARISNLAFDFPWAKLDIPQLVISDSRDSMLQIQLKNSVVNTAFIGQFFPDIKLPFVTDVKVGLNGLLVIGKEKIMYSKMACNLLENTTLMVDGYTGISEMVKPDMNLEVTKLHTSLTELEQLFGFKVDESVKAIDIIADATVSGSYENLDIEGLLNLNGMAAKVKGQVRQSDSYRTDSYRTDKKGMDFSYNLSTGLLDPNRLYEMDGTLLKLTNLKLSGTAGMDAKNQWSDFAVKLVADSVNLDDYCFKHPDIKFGFSPQKMNANIALPGLVTLDLNSSGNLSSEVIQYNGSLKSMVPQWNNMDSSTGDFYSAFNGVFENHTTAKNLEMVLETIQFKPKYYKKTYQSNGVLSAGRSANGDLHLNMSIDTQEMIRFHTTSELIDWWEHGDKWAGNYPATELDVAANIDSMLIGHLIGTKGVVHLNQLQVRAHDDEFTGTVDMPAFVLDSFDFRNVKGNFKAVDGNLNGQLTATHFENPLTRFQDVKITVTQKEKKTIGPIAIGLSLNTFLPEINNHFEFNSLVGHKDSSWYFNLDDHVMQLGTYAWKNLDSKGFIFDDDFNLHSGDLRIVNGNQRISVETKDNRMALRVDSLSLDPVVRLITNDSFFQGDLNLNADYDLKDHGSYWTGAFTGLQVNEKKMGALNFEGSGHENTLEAHLFLNEKYGKFDLSVKKDATPLVYNFRADSIDLTYINKGSPWENEYPVTGMVNAKLDGSYDQKLISYGFMGFKNVESYLTEDRIYMNIREDTLWFEDADVVAKNFKFYDKKGQEVAVNGKSTISADPVMDLAILSKEFRLLDEDNKGKTLKGNVDIASDLHIKRDHNKFAISGKLNILPNSIVSYVYRSTVTLDERENEMTFVSFEKLDREKADTLRIAKPRLSKPIEWDVRLGMENFNMTLILSETYQDNARLIGTGNLLLKTGTGDVPFVFGTLRSNEGRVVYDAPMVSDVDLKIENMLVSWNGDILEPRITFSGSEIFRISPDEIPGMSNTSGVVPVSVIVKVNDRPIDDINIVFDLNSTDAKVKSWIDGLPEDTKQANAINLLLFGSLSFEQSETNLSLMSGLASKMNELSRRNIKSADLTFYTEKQDVTGNSATANERLGYSFSKGLFNNSVKVTVGGTLDFNNTSVTAKSQSANQGSIQLDYIVSTTPEIVLTTSQRTVYDGAINGEIQKSTLGIIFMKRFKNLFKPKNRKKQA